jgi:hypothetical protein
VTVQTYVPHPCRLIGQILDRNGEPLKNVRLVFERELPPGVLRASWDRTRKAKTGRGGVFDLEVLPGAHQILTVSRPGWPDRKIPIKPQCGVGTLRLQLSPHQLVQLR